MGKSGWFPVKIFPSTNPLILPELSPRQGQLLHLASGLVLSFQERLLLRHANSSGVLRWRLEGGNVATDGHGARRGHHNHGVPSGNLLHSELENHYVEWKKSLFLW